MLGVQPIVVTYSTTPGLVRRSNRACHGRALVLRWALSAACVVLGAVLHLWLLLAVGVLLTVLAELSARLQLRPYLQGPRTVTMTITEDGYHVQGPDRATSRVWATVRDVRRGGGFGPSAT